MVWFGQHLDRRDDRPQPVTGKAGRTLTHPLVHRPCLRCGDLAARHGLGHHGIPHGLGTASRPIGDRQGRHQPGPVGLPQHGGHSVQSLIGSLDHDQTLRPPLRRLRLRGLVEVIHVSNARGDHRQPICAETPSRNLLRPARWLL